MPPLSNKTLRGVPCFILLLLCPFAGAQNVWMPDYDGNGFVSTPDLTGFLTAWEMSVDSIVKGAWELECDAIMEGLVPLDSVEFHLAAMDIQLRTDSMGAELLDTAWVDQRWMITNIPVELNHVRFFGPTPFVTGQISYHPEDDSYIWYMEFYESLFLTPTNNPLGALQEEGWFQDLYVFEELQPREQSILLPYADTWYLAPRYAGGTYGTETWTVLDFSIQFHGTP